MATGTIKDASIDTGGKSMVVTVEALSTGGTYVFGLGTNNDPSTAKIILTVTSQGYTDGVLGTRQRTIYGVPCINPATGAMRKAYPNATAADETVSGSDVIIRFALSDFVYDDDTSITVDFASGWYTQGGNASLAADDLAVTNNSTTDYPRVVGNWAVAQAETVVGTSLHLEFVAFDRFGIDRVAYTVTDGTHSVTSNISAMTKSTDSPLGKILVYQDDFILTTLDDNSNCTAKVIVYPLIGDADSILNTDDAVNTFPTPLYTNLNFRLDKVDDHGKTCVDPVSGNDSTGAVYATRALAEAGNAYLTIAAALTALQTYNNTNAGHNDAGGGQIYLKAGTSTLASANGGTLTKWVTIQPATGVSKTEAIFQPTNPSTSSAMPTYLKLSGLTFSGTGYFTGAGTKCLHLYDCALNTTGSYTITNFPYAVVHNCSGILARTFREFASNLMNWALLRGNDMTSYHQSFGWTILGNKNISVYERTETTIPLNNNLIYAFNEAGNDGNTTTQISLNGTNNYTHGMAIIQNKIIRYGSQTNSLINIKAAEPSVAYASNVLLWHNSVIGGRANLGYNEGSTTYNMLNWSQKNNIFSNWNNKDDTFTPDAAGIGAWPIGYWVGASGNFVRTSANEEWFGEFPCGLYSKKGTTAVPVSPAYIDDNSADGDNTSGGNYHLSSSSPCLTLAHELILPYDFEGLDRSADGHSGAYATSGAYTLAVISGALTLSGTAVSLKADRKLAVASGSLLLNGTDIILQAARKLIVNSGAITLSGNALNLLAIRILGIDSGSLSLSGTAINLKTARKLSIDSGAIALLGTAVNLLKSSGMTLIIDSGNLSLAGTALSLRIDRKLSIASGVFNLTGSDINLIGLAIIYARLTGEISATNRLTAGISKLNQMTGAISN
jgi:hypothetical protein